MFIKLNQRGFTLVEIMIVVAIIGLLAAIAIPNLLRARMNANEGAVKYDLRTFSSANESYRSAQSSPTYAADVTDLTGSTPAYLDGSWSNGGTKHGFTTDYAAGTNTYSLLATPVDTGTTANNMYCVDQTGSIITAAAGVTGDATGCANGTNIA